MTYRDITTPRLMNTYAITVLACLCVILLIYGSGHYFSPYDKDMGETHIALGQAYLFNVYGFKYGLLDNVGSEFNPILYTHNVNIGSIVYMLLEAVGVHGFVSKQIITLFIFCASLYLVYLTVTAYSSSRLAGLITLLLFSTNFYGVLPFAFNALRSWHWVGLFGTLYATKLLINNFGKLKFINVLVLFLFMVAAFGCGYDFYLITVLAGLACTLFMMRELPNNKLRIKLVVIYLACIVLPVFLRQLQIIAVMGIDYWMHDIYYSVLIKVPMATRVFGDVDLSKIDNYYRSVNVLRPPASPSADLGQVFYTLKMFLEFITIPTWGLLSFILATFCLIFSSIVIIFKKPDYKFFNYCCLMTGIIVGAASGLVLLSPFSFHVYLKHEFPLVAALLLVPKGFIIYYAITKIFPYWSAK